MNIIQLRREYSDKALHKEDLNPNPFKQFEVWFNDAIDAQIIESNAMSLATVDEKLRPSIRTVLLKLYDEKGFVFFSNYKSKKAEDIAQNPNVALHFAWLDLQRQLRIEGDIEKVSTAESLTYFLSRPRGSQLGAWASNQSEIVSSRSLLESKFFELKQKFAKGEVPLPDFWGGYRVKPRRFEFWQGGKDRLHDRFAYEKNVKGEWEINRLAP
jgi:pyridoxamine 5'-phosphate oxidase